MDRDGGSAVAAVMTGAGQSITTLHDALQAFAAGAGTTEAPDEATLTGLLAEAKGEMDGTARGLATTLEQSIGGGERAVAESGEQARQSADQLGQGAVEQIATVGSDYGTRTADLQAGSSRTLGQLRTAHATQAGGNATTAIQGFDAINDGIAELFAAMDKALEDGFKTGAKNLEDGLRKQVLEGDSETGAKNPEDGLRKQHPEKLDKDITTYADEAASKVEPRWKKIAKVLLVIAIVIIVSVALGPLAIAAVGSAATAMGASAGAAAVIGLVGGGAIVGAAASSAGQMTGNVLNGAPVFEGVGKAAVVGAIGGAFGGAGAALGARIASTGLRVGLDVGLDVIGSVVGDLAVGNPITAEGALIGAAIGLFSFGALKGLGRLKDKIKIKVKVDITPPTTRPQLPDTPPLPKPSTRPSVGAPGAPAPRPKPPAAPLVEPPPPRKPAAAEPAPRSPEEAGRRAARETMEEAGEGAAQRGRRRPDADEEAAARRPRDAEADAARRRAGEAGEDAAELAAKKAAEMPAAMAAARTIAEVNDAVDTPVVVVIGLLNALKVRFRWIRRFEPSDEPGAGRYSLWLISSKTKVKDYTVADPTAKKAPPKGKPAEAADPEVLTAKVAKERARAATEDKLKEIATRRAKIGDELARINKRIQELEERIRKLKAKATTGGPAARRRAERQLEAARNKLEVEHGGGLKEERIGLHNERGELAELADNLNAALKLHRPSLRKETKDAILAAAERLPPPDGRYISGATGKPIDGPIHFGHQTGQEHRRLALEAQKKGMNQAQFNDWVNKNHKDLFRVESEAENLSHAFEKPGID